MFSFSESTAAHFCEWAFESIRRDNSLVRSVLDNPDVTQDNKKAWIDWTHGAQQNYERIIQSIHKGYDWPELEVLRIEICICIVNGLWQSAMGATNMLLEKSLKRSLQYSGRKKPEETEGPVTRLSNSLDESVSRVDSMKLFDTIEEAFRQNLIDEETRSRLHTFRSNFRNAFSHAEIKKMVGEKTMPVTGIDFATGVVEHKEVPLALQVMMSGEIMWQVAEANAIPYFLEVDGLVRNMHPIVFRPSTNEPSEA